MLTTHIILLLAFGYVGLLFAIAYFADRRAAQGRMASIGRRWSGNNRGRTRR